MTTTLNRHIAPKINAINAVEILMPDEYKLSNGTPVFVFNNPNQELLKIELVFEAGVSQSPKPLVASITNAMLIESTHKLNSNELAEAIDYYGASFETKITRDNSSVSLYSLNKFLKNTLPLLADVIKNAAFENKELDLHLARKKQEFQVNSQKVDFIARQNFTKILFGESHPYGRASQIEDYDNISIEDLIAFHKANYKHGAYKIFIAGKFTKQDFALLDKLFGDMQLKDNEQYNISWNILPAKEKYQLIKHEGAVQNALRMGFIGLQYNHKDYHGLRILTTFLGGYFGSRLMNNIREDKGYTYGIGAAHSAFAKESVFFIATEVNSEVSEDTLSEIKKELHLLQTEEISDNELNTVKNYLQGSFQRKFDGSFALLEQFKNVEINNLDYSYYYDYIEKVKNIDAKELKSLAQKYFNINSFYILNVGK